MADDPATAGGAGAGGIPDLDPDGTVRRIRRLAAVDPDRARRAVADLARAYNEGTGGRRATLIDHLTLMAIDCLGLTNTGNCPMELRRCDVALPGQRPPS